MEHELVRQSKRLSWALRHDPGAAGLVLDAAGWAPVGEVLAALGLAREVLDAVVEGNDKRRFAVRRRADGTEEIRASQGHSVAVELGLAAAVPPATLFHGTPTVNLGAIRTQGLHRGRRQHVHLSADQETAERVGRRRRLPATVLAVDCAAMTADGYVFYLSANGVWLTGQVPARYLRDVSGAGPR